MLLITTGTFSFQDGTDSIICSVVNGSTLVGHYPIEGYQTPVRTKQVNWTEHNFLCYNLY